MGTSVRDRTTFSSEYPAIHRDGRTVWLRDVARLVGRRRRDLLLARGGAGRHRQQDGRRSAPRVRGSLRLLVEHFPALVYIDSNDEDPKSLYVSPNVVELFGYKPEEYLEQPEHVGTNDPPRRLVPGARAWREAVRTGEPFQEEYRFVRPDGRVVWVIDDALLVGAPLRR